jgi:hypothetical protein
MPRAAGASDRDTDRGVPTITRRTEASRGKKRVIRDARLQHGRKKMAAKKKMAAQKKMAAKKKTLRTAKKREKPRWAVKNDVA